MVKVLMTLRVVQWTMLASIVVYAVVGEFARPTSQVMNPSMSYVFATLGVAIVGMIFVVRRTLVWRAATSLSTQPEDALSLNHWRTGYLAIYALCESLALFGLVLRFLGGSQQQSAPYYIGGFVLMAFFVPRRPKKNLTLP
jgi:cytochrome b561